MANERANVVPLAGQQPARKPVVGFMRVDAIQIQPIDWLIDGWIAKDSLAGLVGPSGSCKSFLAIDWACRVATGTPWNGCDVQRGAVFVIAGEGRNGLRKRVEGWSFNTGVSIEGAPLFIASTMPPLADGVGAAHVIAEIEELTDELFFNCGGIEPSLIVIDTVARAMVGKNENSAQDVGELVKCMDWLRERWGCTVLAVHHTGHDATGRARGSSSFYAALDSEVLMKPRANALELKQTKAKDWQPPHPILLKPSPVFVNVPGTDTQTTTLVLMNGGKAERPVDRMALVRQLHEEGKTVRQIAAELNIGKSTAADLVKKLKGETDE